MIVRFVVVFAVVLTDYGADTGPYSRRVINSESEAQLVRYKSLYLGTPIDIHSIVQSLNSSVNNKLTRVQLPSSTCYLEKPDPSKQFRFHYCMIILKYDNLNINDNDRKTQFYSIE